ncbi:hypothetical protein E8E11_003231 [Didymella keratinophila]|nr:hypothetical protein E8E11_003231 [Didymella keratinophila]
MGRKLEKTQEHHVGPLDAEANIQPGGLQTVDAYVDLRVLPMVILMYFFIFLDRTNLRNARIAGMDKDFVLGTYGFNIGACLYYAIYLFADIPASLCVKKFEFIVLPLSCVAFGVVTIGTAFVHNPGGFYATRLLPGLTEAFQFGLRGAETSHGPSLPRQPAITTHKERIIWAPVKRGALNVNILVRAWIYTCNQITVQGLSIFTATILRLNFPTKSIIQIQLLSSAPPLVGMVFALSVAYVTMKTRRHGVAIACCASLCVFGYAIWLGSRNPSARFAAIFFNTAGGYGFGVLIIGWTLSNAAPGAVKNVANAAVSGIVNIGMLSLISWCDTRLDSSDVELHQQRREERVQDWQLSEHSNRTLRRHRQSDTRAVPNARE